MSQLRKVHSSEFKLKVVLETYRQSKTIGQISSEYGVHPTQIHKWRQKFKKDGPSVFQNRNDHEKEQQKTLIDELYKQIGQLKVERDWLKKKSEFFD